MTARTSQLLVGAVGLLVAALVGATLWLRHVGGELAPQSQYALALLGLAWRLLGDAREGWLNDYARLVAVVDLEPPPGWSSMAAFNEQLAVELRALHLDRAPPIDQTLRHGTQTLGDIFDQGHPLVDKLKARISEAISRHVAALPVEPGHPSCAGAGRAGATPTRGPRACSSRASTPTTSTRMAG